MNNFFKNINSIFIVSFLVGLGKYLSLVFILGIIVRLLEILLWYSLNDAALRIETFFQFCIYNNWLSSISLTVMFVPIILVTNFLSTNNKKKVITISFFLLAFVQMALMAFFFKSKYLLGPELTRYTLDEVIMISKTVTSFYDVALFLITVILLAWGLGYAYLSDKFKYNWILYPLISIVAIVFIPNNYKHLVKIKDQRFFENRLDFYHGNEKLSYLITSNLEEDKIDVKGVAPYEYYRSKPTENNLGSYFDSSRVAPNVVLIIVESLSSSFSGKANYLGSFTPFLDSLSEHSLVWNNALSCAERTYGALPNILGSAPNGGRKGMSNIRQDSYKDFPTHNSLLEQLNQKKYNTSFTYGGDVDFDHMGYYLDFLSIDNIYCKRYFKKNKCKDNGHGAWGYSDSLVFAESIERLKEENNPFLEIILTTGIHSPFSEKVTSSPLTDTVSFNDDIAKSIVKCDQNLASYFANIKNTVNYENTIFIITGDHNIGELSLKTPLETFHVPLIIYSPKLIKHARFNSMVTHRDITPSLYALLENNYGLRISDSLSYMGNELNTSTNFETNKETSLCLYHEQSFPNLISQQYYLMGEVLYEISDSLLNVHVIENDSIKTVLKSKRMHYQQQDAVGIELGLRP